VNLRTAVLTAIFWMLLGATGLHGADEGWVKVLSQDGIDVWNKPSKKGETSWVRGTTTDSVRMEVLAQVLLDVTRYPRWMDDLKESRIVETTTADDYILYNRYRAIWPLWDRDIYLRVQVDRQIQKGLVPATIQRFESPKYPPLDGVVRIPMMEGSLRMEYISRTRTRGEFAQLVDLGGSLPAWAKDHINRKMPLAVLRYVRKACRDKDYIAAADTSAERRAIDVAVQSGALRP